MTENMSLLCAVVLSISYSFIIAEVIAIQPKKIEMKVLSHTEATCTDKGFLKTLRSDIEEVIDGSILPQFNIGLYNHVPANSCADIYSGHPSGYYWLNVGGQPQQVYCSLNENRCCNQTHANWMRIAYLNMSDPTQQCPSGWREVDSPIRTCRRQFNTGINSVSYSSNGIPYSRVCGRIKAYQFGTPEVFQGYHEQNQRTLDYAYVDGVSITYGQNPRCHIWTLAAPRGNDCHCTRSRSGTTTMEPSFINGDYFCERGSIDPDPDPRFVKHNPLWDGSGCTDSSTCCEFNNPPWFCQQLPQSTTEDIEIRLMASVGGGYSLEDEDTPIELIEIYIQ